MSSGRLALWQTSYKAYYREYWMLGTNMKSGSHGQYTNTRENQYKSLLDRRQTLTASQRIQWTPIASNGDSTSQKQTLVAKAVLDYMLKTKRLQDKANQVDAWGEVLGEGFVTATWDAHKGKVAGHVQEPDGTVRPVREGDIKSHVLDPTCVVRDCQVRTWEDCDWVITITQENKYDEAAKHPNLADEIVSLSINANEQLEWYFQPTWWMPNDDLIEVYHFYHKKTPACPQGRYVKFYADNLVCIEMPLPYEDIPVYRYAPDEHLGSPFGWTVAFNLLPMQECVDIVEDSVITNHELYGVQHVAALAGGDIQYQQLPNGGNYIEVTPIPGVADPFPKGLNLMAVSPDSYKYKGDKIGSMQTISGVNSVARGQPPEGVTAGTAMALIQTMAIQSNSKAQANWVSFLERFGTGIVSVLREYASVPRIAEIAGKDKGTYVQEFSAKDLSDIRRVTVELGNPLTDTTAGRLNIAEALLQGKLISTPQEYLTVLRTGTLDPLVDGDEAELLLIRKENEGLSDGEQQQAMEFDLHQLHIQEHRSVLADPNARRNPALVKAVTDHISAHKQFMQPSAPPAPPPGTAPPQGQQPQAAPPPAPAPAQYVPHPPTPHAPKHSPGETLQSPAATQAQAAMIGAPKLPQSPLEPKLPSK